MIHSDDVLSECLFVLTVNLFVTLKHPRTHLLTTAVVLVLPVVLSGKGLT